MVNDPEDGYGCPYCDKDFRSYAAVVAHVAAEHPGNP